MIQALFAGAATAGEKAAAGARAERIRARLREAEKREEAIEIPFSLLIRGRVTCSSPCAGGMPSPLPLSADAPAERHGSGVRRRSCTPSCGRNFRRSTPR